MPEQVTESRATLFYDGQCPICASEIARLKTKTNAELEFVDFRLRSDVPLPLHQLESQLHLQRGDGSWITGLDANLEAWQHARYTWLVALLRLPIFYGLAKKGYALWLIYYHARQKKAR